MRKKTPITNGLVIKGCTITTPPAVVNEAMASAVKAVADASAAHARALEKIAERLAGPASIGIQVNGNGNRLP